MPSHLPRTTLLLIPTALVLALLVFGYSSRKAASATFTVTTAADSGAGSLRQAIMDANASGGFDTIEFDAGAFPVNNPATIMPATPLPASTDPASLEVDGTGAGVIIDGSAAGAGAPGLEFYTSAGVGLTDVQVRSVTIQNFTAEGILVCGGAPGVCGDDVGNTVISFVDVTGNGAEGIAVYGQDIGGTTLSDCTSSGNGSAGILLLATQQLTTTEIMDCELENNGTQAMQLRGVNNLAETSVVRVSAMGNPNDGLWLRSPSGIITATVITDYEASDVATGLHFDAGLSVSDATVTSADLNGNTTGMKVESASGNISSMTFDEIATSNSDSHGMLFDTDAAISNVAITDCTSNDNGDKGIEVVAGNGVTNFAITDCSTSGNTNHGINVRPGAGGDITDLALRDVVANGNGNYGINPNTGGTNLVRFTIENVDASGNASSGIYANGAGGDIVDAMVSGLTASNNAGDGLDMATSGAITGATISEGTFTGNGDNGLEIDGPASVSFNRIFNNTADGVDGAGPGAVVAERNWWGCNEGPAGTDCDSATGDVDFDPWLVLSIAADPDPAIQNQVGALFGAVTMTSSAAGEPAEMSIPDGTVIAFGADAGFVDPGASPTEAGVAETAYTPVQAGTATVSAMLDAETVDMPLEVIEATPTPSSTPTASAGPSGTATATVTATPGPTLTPAGQTVAWGDANCSGEANPVDSLLTLRADAGLSVNTGACPPLGTQVEVLLASLHVWGDIDCSGALNPVDSLKILRFDAGLSVAQGGGCPAMGAHVQIVVPAG